MATVQRVGVDVSDAEFEQFEDHVIDVAKRTHGALVDHYRPFLAGRVPPKALEKYLGGILGGSFVAIGVQEMKDAGFSMPDVVKRIEAAWAEDEGGPTPSEGDPR